MRRPRRGRPNPKSLRNFLAHHALKARAVEMVKRERGRVQPLKAPEVDSDRKLSLLVSATREGPNAAVLTEEVVNALVVELVITQ